MKNKYILWIVLLISQLSTAQTRRFVYEYRFAVDSTKVDTLKTEMMFLDIDQDKSTYFAEKKFKDDSINLKSVIRQQKLTPNSISVSYNSEPWNVEYVLIKHYPSYKMVLKTSVEHSTVAVKTSPKMNWEIQPDTEKIAGYSCQKAIVDFGGRHWEAWFTMEIPIPEGPYKFHGLPGLIVKMEDATKTHLFLLKGNENLTDKKGLDYIYALQKEAYGGAEKSLDISDKQYRKMIKQYRNDPVKDLRQRLSSKNYKMIVKTPDGREVSDSKEVLRFQEKRIRENFKKYNNAIELDVYQ